MKIDRSFKPMLASPAPALDKLAYPVMASPKLDGIRCIILGGQAVSRNLKPIPNRFVQTGLNGLPDGLDGELIVGAPNGKGVFDRTSSGVMSRDGTPDFMFWVFDDADHGMFRYRHGGLHRTLQDYLRRRVSRLDHVLINSASQLMAYENLCVSQGYEGIMIRDPEGPYKFGRSTTKEGFLLKLKRFEDAEAVVVDFVEQMHNGNEATTDALGRTKRSAHKANKTGKGTLGALVCTFRGTGKEPIITTFEIGTGFDDKQRAMVWHNQDYLRGAIVKFKYQELSKDGVPRFPVFLGWRNANDL